MNQENIVAGTSATAPRSPAETVEKLFGPVEWASTTMGYCLCPGRKVHSTTDGKRDCVIYLDRVPTIHCMHASCGAEVEKANRALRAAILNPNNDDGFAMPRLTAEDKARIAERSRNERLRVRAIKSLPQVLKKHCWTYDEMLNDSPVDVKTNLADHWKLLLGKFAPSDFVWIGAVRDSGKRGE